MLLISLSAGEVNRDHELQCWYYFSTNDAPERVTFETEYRFGDNGRTLYLYYFQSRWIHEVTPWLEIASGYRQLYVLSERWIPIYAPLVDLSIKRATRNLEIIDRTRIQYLIVESDRNFWQIRNRILLKGTWQLCGCILHPLLRNELFFRERVGFSENRLAAGIQLAELSLLYQVRHLRVGSEWRQHNVIEVLLCLPF